MLSETKKKHRDEATYKGYETSVLTEIGDVLWYVSAIATRGNISLPYLMHNLDNALASWGATVPRNLKFVDIRSRTTRRLSAPTPEFDRTLLQLAAEVGLLVVDERAGRLENNQAALAGRLSAVLRALRAAADEAGVTLAEAACGNLKKIFDRWPAKKIYPRLLDDGFPKNERLPRKIRFDLIEDTNSDGKHVVPLYEGVQLGDKLTDNRMEDDDYRFHDAFHLAFAAKLGWSPNIRRLLKKKRKSVPKVDQVQDGARAVLIEEGISTWIFNHAQRLDFFDGADSVDGEILKVVRQFVEGYEVQDMPLWLWEEAILDGYTVFRELRKRRRGAVTADLDARTVTFKELP
nr:pyrophosphatase [Hansschlegelia beijingensis]